MARNDYPIWLRALPSLSAAITQWYYDAAVGDGVFPITDPADPFQSGYWRLTRKRIDAAGEAPDHWLLIEVRPAAGLGALGAIQTYRSLWERDPPDTRPVRAMIVTDRTDADTMRTAVNASIQILEV
jgi:hypothetical protein